jgi:hypothetical protein
MTKAQATFMLMVLCGQLGLAYSVAVRPPEAPVVAAPVRCSYRVEVVGDMAFESTMTLLGAEGWSVVSARRANSAAEGAPMVMAYELILQRPVTAPAPAPVAR